jgi:hypothetical protein
MQGATMTSNLAILAQPGEKVRSRRFSAPHTH